MDWQVAATIAVAAAAFCVVCGWRGARPPDIHKGPRMVPWRLLMVSSAVVVLLMLVHLANLAGVSTGR